jgi:hypothetical protein
MIKKTLTGLVMSAGFAMGGSAAETVANDDRPNAVSAIDDRANALRVMWFCFILLFVCLFGVWMLCVSISVFVKKVIHRGHGSHDRLVRSSCILAILLLPPELRRFFILNGLF